MKYYRKHPVEAMQWTGDNYEDFCLFVDSICTRIGSRKKDGGKIFLSYLDIHGRNHEVNIPAKGWVVVEGKTLQFYKDETFHKTFKPAEDDGKGIDWDGMTDTINKAFYSFDDIFNSAHGVPRRDIIDAIKEKARAANTKRTQALADFLQRGCISREEAEKHLLGGVTFDSVLDEMKELHAKKNKDYGDAFHKSFVEFGPVAAVVRLNDKMERIKSLIKNGKAEVKDESVLDSLRDLACYAVMLYVELKNKDNGTDKD